MKKILLDRRLAEAGVRSKDAAGMVQVVETANLEDMPADARSLLAWLARAREVLSVQDGTRSDSRSD